MLNNECNDLLVLNMLDKYRVIDGFIKILIDDHIIDIFADDNSIDENKIFAIQCARRVFDEYEFISSDI